MSTVGFVYWTKMLRKLRRLRRLVPDRTDWDELVRMLASVNTSATFTGIQ